MRGDQQEQPHEYVSAIDNVAAESRDRFVVSINDVKVHPFGQTTPCANATDVMDAVIVAGDLAAHIQALFRRGRGPSKAKGEFEPHLFVGSHEVRIEDKLRLAFMGRIVAAANNRPCSGGVVVKPDGKSQRIAFAPIAEPLNQILGVLRPWVTLRDYLSSV